ncbi:MAG: aminopeptidase P family protein [Candidatus Saganbacteria bacterium]|nr:aminopeptidase P family protein [Candidatus Saganbacteria bacterium]
MNGAQRQAVRIAVTVLKHLAFRPGETEKQVARRIEAELKKYGAKPAFRTIVASGQRSALPHGYAANKKIRPGEQVMIDFGALYRGRRSDVTRTYLPSKPTKKQKAIYRIVKEAQARGIEAVRAGVEARMVDRAARNHIIKKGYGLFFVHTTGHGVGRRIHEAPKLSRRNRHKLKAGQVVTVEPGIYIKGWGGVRIEDMVLVTGTGCRLLTTVPK